MQTGRPVTGVWGQGRKPWRRGWAILSGGCGEETEVDGLIWISGLILTGFVPCPLGERGLGAMMDCVLPILQGAASCVWWMWYL
jgi:hypothetical protein